MCFLMLDYTRILITHQHHLKEGIVHVWVGLDDLKIDFHLVFLGVSY